MHETSSAVIVAAGRSHRMQGRDKLWIPLAGRITLARTIDVFEGSPLIDAIILVVNAERLDETRHLCQAEHWQKISTIIPGGPRRQDSVSRGLEALMQVKPACRWVMIQDAARPLVTPGILEAGYQAVQKDLATIAAVPVKDTIKQLEHGQITATPDRSQLWSIQTPQVFSFPLIYQAYHSPVAQEEHSDDASLLECLGYPVTIFPSSYT